ncbi:hypothetical protein GCM10027037_14260 [Mucilaginibacter koreensis]
MEFGKVRPEQLATVDFTLPPDPDFTTQVLAASPSAASLQVYVGCPTWVHSEWKGLLYPPKTKDTDFLTEYAKQFNSIELNATYYRVFDEQHISKWRAKAEVNPDFKFCPKFSQIISHHKRLKNASELTTAFYRGIMAFEKHLGPVFLQLSDTFTPKSYIDLKAFLQDAPTDVPLFTELRDEAWFANPQVRDEVFGMMHNLNVGSIITDAAGRRDCVHLYLPTPHAFIRYVGNDLHPSDYLRIDAWVQRIKQWQQQGLQSLYFFVHQHDEHATPVIADYLIEQLNKNLGLNLKRPRLIPQQQGLF